ncbi:MAG: hypothetical protein AAF497_03250 [Planctomycetota bacterium]
MTLVGKILSVLILVMSIVFMAFTCMTYATHRNWSDIAKDRKTKFDNAERMLRDKEAEIEAVRLSLSQEKAARSKAIAALEDKNRDQKEKLELQQEKLTAAESEKRKSIQIAETAQREMDRLKDEVDAVRVALKTALDDRNDKLARVTDLRDRNNQLEGQLQRVSTRVDTLRTSLSRSKLVLDRNGLNEFTPVDNTPPELDGEVTKVNSSSLIEVSIGSDEGLRKGHTLDIFRQDGSYIGRVQVIDTNSDRAVARIIPKYRQGVIRKGDRVATKLL